MISAWSLRTDITKHERYVGKVPTNETARAVGRCGVGRGRANNGWSAKSRQLRNPPKFLSVGGIHI
jgi:hypothetical protein